MARRLRTDLPDGLFHVTARGAGRIAIYRDDEDYRLFLRLLGMTVERRRWHCLALCLMPNHYHLVLDTTRRRLSRGFHWLNGSYAQAFNRRHGRWGHLFGDRFSSWVVVDEEHVAATCEYVRANPVRAGLCTTVDDWPWSGSQAAVS
jgi:REP-associated tyrosine transposase